MSVSSSRLKVLPDDGQSMNNLMNEADRVPLKKIMTWIMIYGPKRERERFARSAAGAPARYRNDPLRPVQALSFHALVPVPQDLLARVYTWRSGPGIHDSGRDWEVQHWGCPRGAIESRILTNKGHTICCVLGIEAPPVEFLAAVSARFPKLTIDYFSIETKTLVEWHSTLRAGRTVADSAP